jgi:hypothetical protein
MAKQRCRVTSVDVSRDGRLLLTHNEAGHTVLWDAATEELLHEYELRGGSWPYSSAKFHPSGMMIARHSDSNCTIELRAVPAGARLNKNLNSSGCPYDAFLSYNKQDKAAVIRVAEDLKKLGYRPFMYDLDVRGGEPILSRLDDAIKTAPVGFVILGASGFGDFHRREEAALLLTQTEAPDLRRNFRTAAVFLPGSPDGIEHQLSVFCRENKCIDLRSDYRDGLAEMIHLIEEMRGQVKESRPYSAPKAEPLIYEPSSSDFDHPSPDVPREQHSPDGPVENHSNPKRRPKKKRLRASGDQGEES